MSTKQGNGILRNARDITLVAGMALALDHSALLRADTPGQDYRSTLKQSADHIMNIATNDNALSPSMRIGNERVAGVIYEKLGFTNEWRRSIELAAATYEGEGTQSGFSNAAALYRTLGDKKKEREVSAPTPTDIAVVDEGTMLIGAVAASLFAATAIGLLYTMRKQRELDDQKS